MSSWWTLLWRYHHGSIPSAAQEGKEWKYWMCSEGRSRQFGIPSQGERPIPPTYGVYDAWFRKMFLVNSATMRAENTSFTNNCVSGPLLRAGMTESLARMIWLRRVISRAWSKYSSRPCPWGWAGMVNRTQHHHQYVWNRCNLANTKYYIWS